MIWNNDVVGCVMRMMRWCHVMGIFVRNIHLGEGKGTSSQRELLFHLHIECTPSCQLGSKSYVSFLKQYVWWRRIPVIRLFPHGNTCKSKEIYEVISKIEPVNIIKRADHEQ
jgi:hypothetical protein